VNTDSKNLPTRQFVVNRWVWFGIASVLVFDGLALWFQHVRVQNSENIISALAFIIVVSGLISLAAYMQRNDTVCIFGNVLSQLACQGMGIGFLSYIAATTNLPLADAALVRVDAALGFDWQHYIYWLDTLPASWHAVFRFTYNSFKWQLVMVPFLLLAYRQLTHAQRFIIVLFLSAIISIGLAALFPALGAYNYFGIDAHSLHHIDPTFIREEQGTLAFIRAHPAEIILPLRGVICFPSFHAVVAILLIYVSLPLRFVRLGLVPFNIIMLIATISEGGHYLIDVLLGIAISAGCIYIAERVLPVKALFYKCG